MSKYKSYKTGKKQGRKLESVETVEGETIEQKVARILANNEPISDGAPEIFTERKDGVQPAYNIRTDRFEIATEAMDVVNKSRVAKRDGVGQVKETKVIELKDNKDGEAEPTQGTK